ncbi:MAG: hypothetical protein ACJAVR_004221 [Paracoccaceae bacterium]|jgi:hypothetical protein
MQRLSGGILRALIVLLAMIAPAALVPGVSSSAREISFVIGAITGLCVLFEYAARNPGLIDFRFAPPYNRSRFAVFTAILFMMIFFVRAQDGHDGVSGQILSASLNIGARFDFFLSPVAMVGEMLGDPASPLLNAVLRGAAALSFVTALTGTLFFGILFWVTPWPTGRETFNLWINLPTLETAYGAEVERRLFRLAFGTIMVGLGAPYALLALASQARGVFVPAPLLNPLVLVWGATIWAALPMYLVLRGVAIAKIAWLIRRAR